MIQDFSFVWKGKKWNGFINAVSNGDIRVHFEDSEIREIVGGSLNLNAIPSDSLTDIDNPEIAKEFSQLYQSITTAVKKTLKKV